MNLNHDQATKVRKRHHHHPKNEKISLYVYDKYAAKYSADQLDLILRRSKGCGQQSTVAVWLLFILFAIFVDFLRLKSFVTSQETYHIGGTIDGGLISNFSIGKFGWPIILLAVSCISLVLIEAIISENYLFVAGASATLLTLEICTIITCMALNVDSTSARDSNKSLRWDLFGSLNLAAGCTMCLAWIIWHSIELILLIHGTRRVHDAVDMNQDMTLLSRQRIKVVNSESSSRRRDRNKVKQPQTVKAVTTSKKSLNRVSKSMKSPRKSSPTIGTSSKISKSRKTISKKSIVGPYLSKLSDASGSNVSSKEVPKSKISLKMIHSIKNTV